MKNFIEVTGRNGNRHLINIRYIEEIAEESANSCLIFLGVVTGESQDYYAIDEPYEVMKKLIGAKEGDE